MFIWLLVNLLSLVFWLSVFGAVLLVCNVSIPHPQRSLMQLMSSSDLCPSFCGMHPSATSGLGCSHLLSRGSLILEGTWWRTLHNSDERSTLPPSSSSDFSFSLTHALLLSAVTQLAWLLKAFRCREPLPATFAEWVWTRHIQRMCFL